MSIAASDVALGAATGTKRTLDSLVPKTEHHYVVGALLLFVGLIGIAGSITGTLPAMIAGLFEPSALGTVASNTTSTTTTTTPPPTVIGTPTSATAAQKQNAINNKVFH